jgi:phosphatidylinositol glycan class B
MKSNLLYHSILVPSLIVIRIVFHSFYLVSNTQFDPDENWQNHEPAYCIVFAQVDSTTYQRGVSHNCVYTWEWTRRRSSLKSSPDYSTSQQYSHFSRLKHLFLDALHGPVRSHVALLPTIFIYTICKRFRWDSRDVIAFYGPYLIHGLLIVIPTDIAIGVIATICESYTNITSSPTSRTATSRNPTTVRNWAMFASLTNWFLAYTLTRTYSNSIECMLLSVGVALVLSALHQISWLQKEYDTRAQSIVSDHAPMKSFYAKAPFFSFSISSKIALAFFLGGLSLSIRFSSVAAWAPLGLITSLRLSSAPSIRSHGLKETAFKWNKCFKAWGFCAFFGMLGLLLSCLVDRYYYGFWALPFLGNFHFNVLLGMLFPFFHWNRVVASFCK